MKILNDFGNRNSAYRVGFKSVRTDKASAAQLKIGASTISENNKANILASLNNLSAEPTRGNIEFLLDIADNLAYGEFGNQQFIAELNSDGVTPEERENTVWSKILEDTIRQALDNTEEENSDLEGEFARIFSGKTELTPEQRNLLDLRTALTKQITDEKVLKTEEDIARAAKTRQNLDYFVASSEIPLKEKQKCLEDLIYFMSDDYKINPQLSDKKAQVVDEVLNDLVIKTPAQKELTIKSVDQRVTGICAAISICRKAMAYENKSGFVELIMEELKDSPTMSVYDITELGSGKKVELPKINVKYADAMNKGYRIIDSSAHIWMNNAHASGDGTIQTEHYIPFDDDSYGIYDDSSWYLGLSDELSDEKLLLAVLIKEKEYIKSVYNTKKAMKATQQCIPSVKSKALWMQSSANGTLNKELSGIFKEKTQKEINQLTSSLIDFYTKKSEDNQVNISDKMSDEYKGQILTDFISEQTGATPEQKKQVREKAQVLNHAVEDYVKADESLKKLQRFNTKRSKYLFNKKLYKAGAAHRLAIEADVNLPDGVVRFERLSGLPVRNKQITNHINAIAVKTGNKEAYKDAAVVSSTLPTEIDGVLKTLTGKNMAEITVEILNHQKDTIEQGDEDTLTSVMYRLNLNTHDKQRVSAKLAHLAEKMQSNPTREEVLDTVRMLGYENEVSFAAVIMNSLINAMEKGISEEEFARLSEEFGGEENVGTGIMGLQEKLANIAKKYDDICEKWQVPSAREQILNQMEKNNSIISRRKLDTLKNHFAKIDRESAKNERILNMKEREKANNKLYTFTQDEEATFNSIEKNLGTMKRYCNMQYNNLNKILFDLLESQYSEIGMLNGQFWVREEGSSGLTANEQIRIIEQMTGKPYHMEKDVTEAAKQIKRGQGSGIVSLSVDDSDYAFHAQYVPVVTEETFKTQDGNGTEKKDVLWTDNSWGLAEKEHYWIGESGHRYTDYNRGFGWKNGFLVSSDLKIGLPVSDIFAAKGTSTEDKEDFGLFTDVVLPGTPINSHQKLMKMFGYIFNVREGEEQLKALEENIKNGAVIDINYLEGLDDLAEAKTTALAKRIENEIKSEEDFNKLPDDDPIKFEFEKIALYLSTDNPMAADTILTVTDRKGLEEAHDAIVDEHVNTIGSIIAKSEDCLDMVYAGSTTGMNDLFKEMQDKFKIKFDDKQKNEILKDMFVNEDELKKHDGSIDGFEKYLMEQVSKASKKHIKNRKAEQYFEEKAKEVVKKAIDEEIRITSLTSNALQDNPLKDEFIAAIDKYLKPVSDEDLLTLLQGFQHATFEVADKFIETLSDEDLGLRIKKPYDYIKLYKADDANVHKAFSEIVATEEIYANLPDGEDDSKTTPEELYRSLHVKLSEMDVQKYIKAFKAEAFQKYKVRQAFPQPVVIKDEEVEKMTLEMLNVFKKSVDNIESNKFVIKLLEKYNELYDVYLSDSAFAQLLTGQVTDFSETDTELFEGFKETVEELKEIAKVDASLDYIAKPLEELSVAINSEDSHFNAKHVLENIGKIVQAFKDFEETGITVEKFNELNRSELATIKNGMHLMVNANIEPKYRNQAINLVKNIIDLYRKEAPQDEIEYQEDRLLDLMEEKHIVKNPTVLLKEYIKLVQAGKDSTDEAQALRKYLTTALTVAQQTKIQYKLVQNQHEAISSKTKEMLPTFAVTMTDGTKRAMASDTGMLYLIEQLSNESDNHTILKLFLSQTGMSQAAVNAMINNFDMQSTLESLINEFNRVKKNIEDTNVITSEAKSFFEQSNIQYKSIYDAIHHLRRYMKAHLKHADKHEAFKQFLDYLKQSEQGDGAKSQNQEVYKTILNEIYIAALQYVAENVNSRLDYINGITQYLTNRQTLINEIEIPDTSDEYKKRETFNEDFKQIYELVEEQQQEIFKKLEESPAFGVEPKG